MSRNKPAAHYRARLRSALEMFRSGNDATVIARRHGGLPEWWALLMEAASEIHTDEDRLAIIDMRMAGFSIERICLETGLTKREVLRAIGDYCETEPLHPVWDKDFQQGLADDFEIGLTIPQIRRKYGYPTDATAKRAIDRALRLKRNG